MGDVLRLYNTRRRRVETFVPLRDGEVRIYVCGLTPSAEAHLGHARSFLFFDVLRRYLVHLGYRVTFVQNVTDIDDRSIAAGAASGTPWNEIVNGYYASFKRSMQRLHVREPDHEPRATAYIESIVSMIGELIERGHAYAVGDGVYFAVRSFARYGELSGRNVDELMIGARIAPGEEKRDPLDFALWKFAKPGEPSWPSPWGAGRPGWHIECSAMSRALLGEPFDIHGGGYDLIFPHHENEIAQTESLLEDGGRLTDAGMAKFWVHGGLLQFDGKKMSKSLGNFEPLSALLDRHDPQAIRLLFLQTGYRKPMNFTESAIAGATSGLARLFAAYDLLRHAEPGGGPDAAMGERLEKLRARFFAALDDDMNTAGALGALFGVVENAAALVAGGSAGDAAAFLHEALELLGVSPLERAAIAAHANGPASVAIDASVASDDRSNPGVEALERHRDRLVACMSEHDAIAHPPNGASALAVIREIVAARAAARQARDFATADRLRKALAGCGMTLEDTPGASNVAIDLDGDGMRVTVTVPWTAAE